MGVCDLLHGLKDNMISPTNCQCILRIYPGSFLAWTDTSIYCTTLCIFGDELTIDTHGRFCIE